MLQEYPWLIPAAFLVVGGGVCLILSFLNKGKKTVAEEKGPKETELTERFCMSRYLCGLPGANTSAPLVYCGVTEGSFLFSKGSGGVELGRIPRGSIKSVIVGDKSQIAQQFSEQEKLCLGKTAADKKDSSSCLVLSWNNSDGAKHNTVFEFAEQAASDKAAQALKNWIE